MRCNLFQFNSHFRKAGRTAQKQERPACTPQGRGGERTPAAERGLQREACRE